MATFLLLHGASRGGWVWKFVSPLLRQAGHRVLTPTLTGSGDRVHLASPIVTLDTYIQDIVNVVLYEDLQDVIVAGHSQGGLVMTAVSEQIPERLGHLVYLDSPVLRDGESGHDTFPPHSRAAFDEARRGQWQAPAGAPDPTIFSPEISAWMAPRLTSHLVRPSMDPVRLRNPAALALPRTYVFCTQTAERFPAAYARKRLDAEGVPYVTLEATHDVMITAPAALSRLLIDIANTRPRMQ